jgi:hypothetical protein
VTTLNRRAGYEAEIRDYLLGRITKPRAQVELPVQYDVELPTARILDWWIFEGKRYRGLDRPLALEWVRVHRAVQLLLASYNPRWRMASTPEGEVDWLATALTSAQTGVPEFVCRTTNVGLTEEEREALVGWLSWIASRWKEHVKVLGPPVGVPIGLPWMARREEEQWRPRQLARWAHRARRSRWPLLRNIVAESLRAILEPQSVANLPITSDDAVLFELVCLVRVLGALDAKPDRIRWLDLESGQNIVSTPLLTCRYQHVFGRELVLKSGEFAPEVVAALERHDVGIPSRADIVVDLPSWSRYGHMVLEAKSGTQQYEAATFQLKCYRAALGSTPKPVVMWGVIEDEGSAGERLASVGADIASEAGSATRDLWLFSSAKDIQSLCGSLQLTGPKLNADPQPHRRGHVAGSPYQLTRLPA